MKYPMENSTPEIGDSPTRAVRVSAVPYVMVMLAAVALWLTTGFTQARAAPTAAIGIDSGAGTVLRARHTALHDQLASNSFNRPLVLESSEGSNAVNGEIFAVVPYAFEMVGNALSAPQGWCEILILHLNTKYCKIVPDGQKTALLMNLGKKFDQPIEESYRLAFAWRLTDQRAEYMRVALTADTGPLSTHDYRITLEAIPLENGSTFLHLSYAYGFGLTGKFAMLAYFSTVGRNKVGFSVVGTEQDGQPTFINGMRGQSERNTMRYYLAIESFLGSLALPASAQFEQRIGEWFTAVERYPRQLHEMDRAEYLIMKRKEYLRQQGDLPVASN
jgi:hypothetical protein